eukprot:Plantae.Rhodophyta-Purpureofilum_apyrenoidigerum.ctg1611.p1 GENE.Plantae.Rhodophyta-Purpureofilum_apyrenoidigerum.ctg1611~~Plantae.Rhodophyta-Purpureofilum_apyrenoidigerum.ctg1611.p1  ORF type:complete len:373 (+),score=84.52 Plantae.Rhodophyta-Purpureofilum_apyrenoidigerum.ctg1611:163-1281(+)
MKNVIRSNKRWSETPSVGALGTKSSGLPELQGVKEGILQQRLAHLGEHGETLRIMVVGESGVGKTTLLSNIFSRDLNSSDTAQGPITKSKGICEKVVSFVLDDVPFQVTMTDTPGFGDYVDHEKSFAVVTDHIDECNEKALEMEARMDRDEHYQDCLIDVILYFFAPHRLKEIDLEMLKRIEGRAPVIPILAKADTMTADELTIFRTEVIRTLEEHHITTFREPFAVVASIYTKKDDEGSVMVGREYPWGFVDVENEDYSDLAALRRCLLTEGLAELKNAKLHLYETYRKNKMLRLRRGIFGHMKKFLVNTTFRVIVIAALVPLALKVQKNFVEQIKPQLEENIPPLRERKEREREREREQRRGGLFGLGRR